MPSLHSSEGRPKVPRFEVKSASELKVGDWAQIERPHVEMLARATEVNAWALATLDRSPRSEMVVHRMVEVPWSQTQPAGSV